MSSASESKVMKIVSERPWLILVLLKVLELGGGSFTATEIAEALGVNSYVVQRALWWLKKYGFVEEVPGTVPRRYKLKSVEDPRIEDLRQNRWVCGNTTVVRISDIYVVLINRREEIVSRVIHRNIVESIQEALTKLGIERDIAKLSQALGFTPQVVAAALRVLDTIFCRRK